MQPRTVILGQVDSLRQELTSSLAAITAPAVDAELSARVSSTFEKALQRLRVQTDALRKRVAGQERLDACWAELHTLQAKAAPVFDECLAFLEGASVRARGLDQGVCALTDALLVELSRLSDVPWNRFTLLATSEFYRPTAAIIRIRYPQLNVWSMPLAAHEFGHYVGPELRRDDDGQRNFPFQKLLDEADETRGDAAHSPKWYQLQEYFADVFATYSLGPAYAAAMILLRMSPSDAHTGSRTHPSNAARVYGILSVLDTLDRRASRARFRDVINLLRELWHENLTAAGQRVELNAAEPALVMERTGHLLELLIETTPERLQFGSADWLRAEGLADEPDMAKLPADLTCRDVLNAAWLARLVRLADDDEWTTADAGRAWFDRYRCAATRKANG